jgi:hypothetical protein
MFKYKENRSGKHKHGVHAHMRDSISQKTQVHAHMRDFITLETHVNTYMRVENYWGCTNVYTTPIIGLDN